MASQKFNPHFSIAALKQQWRLQLIKTRQELSVDRQNQASEKACQQLSQRCQRARFVLSFASFGSEINLWPLNQKLAKEGRLVLPLMAATKELLLFQVNDFSQLEPHRWGMLEPKAEICSPVDFSLIDIALIPGLGFDVKTKYRLGYGQGYYDRLLASPHSTHLWGIGFLEQAVDALPHTNQDLALEDIYLF